MTQNCMYQWGLDAVSNHSEVDIGEREEGVGCGQIRHSPLKHTRNRQALKRTTHRRKGTCTIITVYTTYSVYSTCTYQ